MLRKLIVYTSDYYVKDLEIVYDSTKPNDTAKLPQAITGGYHPLRELKSFLVPEHVTNEDFLMFINEVKELDIESTLMTAKALVEISKIRQKALETANAAPTGHKARRRKSHPKRRR